MFVVTYSDLHSLFVVTYTDVILSKQYRTMLSAATYQILVKSSCADMGRQYLLMADLTLANTAYPRRHSSTRALLTAADRVPDRGELICDPHTVCRHLNIDSGV